MVEIIDPDEWELLKLSLINPISILGLLIVIAFGGVIVISGFSNELIFLYSIGFSIFIFGVSLGYARKSMIDQKSFKNELSDILIIKQEKIDDILTRIEALESIEPDICDIKLRNSPNICIFDSQESKENICTEITLHAIDLKVKMNRIENELEGLSTSKNVNMPVPSQNQTGTELIIGVLLGLWSGIIGSICISSMFELMRFNKESINPITLSICFFVPLLFLVYFTWKCWKSFYNRKL